jgi:glycosyltransferase involved in cell wall biosynthesis
MRIPCAVDLYDNFESFGQARIPGMKTLLRRAVARADVVSCTSEPLRRYVQERYRPKGNVLAMPSTVDRSVFIPRDRTEARRDLGLPVDAKLVGTAGSLRSSKGISTVYEAFRVLLDDPALHLVLAGPYDVAPPAHPRVHYLGELPHARTALLFAALNVGVIYLRDTPFGRYCFPQKAYEMLACEIPVVGARVGATADLLASAPRCLYGPDDATGLAAAIRRQLDAPVIVRAEIRDWAELVGDLERALCAAVADHRAVSAKSEAARASN